MAALLYPRPCPTPNASPRPSLACRFTCLLTAAAAELACRRGQGMHNCAHAPHAGMPAQRQPPRSKHAAAGARSAARQGLIQLKVLLCSLPARMTHLVQLTVQAGGRQPCTDSHAACAGTPATTIQMQPRPVWWTASEPLPSRGGSVLHNQTPATGQASPATAMACPLAWTSRARASTVPVPAPCTG